MTPGTIMGPNLTTDPSMGFAQFSKFRIHELQYPIRHQIKFTLRRHQRTNFIFEIECTLI